MARYSNSDNSSRYIPRDDRRDDRQPRRDDRQPRRDDRQPRRDEREPRLDELVWSDDHEPRRDAYYEAWEGLYGEDVARYIYGEDKTPITYPSICIPRTFPTIRGEQTKRAIFRTFKDLRIGHIDRIDVVHKTDKTGERFCTVYVHLQWNVRNELARDTRKKLLDKQDIKIVYDEPWFWKCTMSTIEKPRERYAAESQHRSAGRPRIDLGEGTRALSRYTQERDERDQRDHCDEHHEEHNQGQLCNMDPDNEE
jgi:hypothetical protein